MASDLDYVVTDGGLYPRGFSSKTEWTWPLVKSSEIVKLNYGRAMRATDRVHGSVPVYGSNGQCGWHNESLRAGPGVILGRKGQGPLGVKWCDKDFWVIDTAYFATPETDELDLRYFYYLAKYIGLNHLKDGTSNPSLSRDTFADLLLPFPPIDTQRAIVSIVKALDDKIELNRRMNATLESLARAIFQSWFVDFDPVRMKSEGRPLTSETSAASPVTLPPAIQDLFPSTFHGSELGEIPDGWSVQSLADMSDLLSGGTPKKSVDAYWNGDLPWISPKVMMTLHAYDSNEHVTDDAVGNGTRLVPNGTVLVMVRGMGLHQGVRISQARRDVTFNQDVKALVPTTVNGDFLLFAMLDAAPYLFGKVQASGHGTGVIPTDILQSLRFAVPPSDILTALTDPLTNINRRIHANTMESSTLSTLRDTLLPKLLSGELPVPAALTATEEALA